MSAIRSYLGRTPIGGAYRSVRNDCWPQLKMRVSSAERQKLFAAHYKDNHWSTEESRSGPGSTLADTVELRRQLPAFLAEHGITSLLDVPCGDWAWMRETPLDISRYIGADIVPELVGQLRLQYGRPGVEFIQLDVVSDAIPEVDAILCRDLLIHLPNRNALKVLRKFTQSGARWLLTTTNTGVVENVDVVQGRFRPVNLCLPPFSLPEPDRVIEEGTGAQSADLGRCLGVWDLTRIAV